MKIRLRLMASSGTTLVTCATPGCTGLLEEAVVPKMKGIDEVSTGEERRSINYPAVNKKGLARLGQTQAITAGIKLFPEHGIVTGLRRDDLYRR